MSLGIPHLREQEMYFANGCDIRDQKALLPDEHGRPAQRLPADVASELAHGSDPRVRHYKWFSVGDHAHEVVLSYFFRCSRQGTCLFVESSRFVLTPLTEEHRAIDALTMTPPVTAVLRLAIASAIVAPYYIIRALLRIARHLRDIVNDQLHATTHATPSIRICCSITASAARCGNDSAARCSPTTSS